MTIDKIRAASALNACQTHKVFWPTKKLSFRYKCKIKYKDISVMFLYMHTNI